MKKEEGESAINREEPQTCWCKQRECVTATQKLEKGGAARPDGFEREENPRLRPSARVIDASPCPHITTQHNTTPPGFRDAS